MDGGMKSGSLKQRAAHLRDQCKFSDSHKTRKGNDCLACFCLDDDEDGAGDR